MTKSEMKTAVEAILFAMGDAVPLADLAGALEEPEIIVKDAIEEMIEEKRSAESGIEIIELDGCYQMCTKKDLYKYLIKLVQIPKDYRLTDVQLETLSIIAYKQPITKADIEKIRGVSSEHTVNRLLETGLIEESGRMQAPGRPMLFVTTQEFLRRFGMGSTDELPDINSEKMETFKMEAEDEIGYHPEPEESVIIGTEEEE